MPVRQLNIRSDEAVERAAALSRRLGKSATQIVVEALRAYEVQACPRDERGLTPSARKRYDSIMRAVKEARSHLLPDADWDESWMYDENGLPK